MPRLPLLLLTWLCTCVLALSVGAQDPVSFVAETTKKQLLENSTFEYKVTLNNARGSDLTPPSFKDFNVVRGPMRSMGTSNINGNLTSYLSTAWQLQPKRTGKFTLRPATVKANGKTLRTKPVAVEVLKVDASAKAAPDHFLRAELSTTKAYVGQQVILNLNLFSGLNTISRNLTQEPDFDGFFAQPRRRYDGRPQSVIENGKEYQRRTLGSIALFPTKSGRLTIDPYRMILGVVQYRTNSTFSRRYTDQVALATDTLYLEVSELPRPQPANFSGGVGNYQMEVQADRDRLTTDDALTLQLTVTGEGDIKRINDFSPVDPADWDVYDPNVLREEFLDSPSGMLGRKVFEFKVVPKRAGQMTIRPSLSYFNVDSAAYVASGPRPYVVQVDQGSGTVTYDVDTTAVGEELVLLPATDLPRGRRYGNDLPSGGLYWALFVLPVLIAGGLVGWRRYQQHLDNRDPVALAAERAARAATRRLETAKVHLDQVAAKPFYDAVEGAIFGYLRDRFQVPTAELSRRNIKDRLATTAADTELIDRYDALLKRCEMALYAGQDKADDLAAAYAEARDLIVDTEKVAT